MFRNGLNSTPLVHFPKKKQVERRPADYNRQLSRNLIIEKCKEFNLAPLILEKALDFNEKAFDKSPKPTLRLTYRTSIDGISRLTAASCLLIALKMNQFSCVGFKELGNAFSISRRELFKGYKDLMVLLECQVDVMQSMYHSFKT
jgi:hypothetical protein